MIPLMIAGAALGALQQEERNKQIQAQNMAAAEQTRWNPWTGMGAGQIQSKGSMLGAALSGGTSGAAGMAKTMELFGSSSQPSLAGDEAESYHSPQEERGEPSYLGGSQMASQLASMKEPPWAKIQQPTLYSPQQTSLGMFASNQNPYAKKY